MTGGISEKHVFSCSLKTTCFKWVLGLLACATTLNGDVLVSVLVHSRLLRKYRLEGWKGWSVVVLPVVVLPVAAGTL
jgi:ABC-type uncharacterized transport system permease subunit